MDTEFQEAMKAVESVTLEVDLAKMTYKDEIKKREMDDSSQQAVKLARLLQTRPRSPKR